MSLSAETERLLKRQNALLVGHFLLSSGLHSDRYCQCAKLFENADVAEQVAEMMARVLPRDLNAEVVLSPAIGGMLWGYELSKSLRLPNIFAERKDGGDFVLRRGFELRAGQKVLIAEDVVTTGKSVLEVADLVKAHEAEVVGYASIVDRSKGSFNPSVPYYFLTRLEFEVYEPADCPFCAKGSEAVKPGSRKMS